RLMVGALLPVSIWLSIARLTPDIFASRSSEWPWRVRSRFRFWPSRTGRSYSPLGKPDSSVLVSPATAGSAPAGRVSDEEDRSEPHRHEHHCRLQERLLMGVGRGAILNHLGPPHPATFLEVDDLRRLGCHHAPATLWTFLPV